MSKGLSRTPPSIADEGRRTQTSAQRGAREQLRNLKIGIKNSNSAVARIQHHLFLVKGLDVNSRRALLQLCLTGEPDARRLVVEDVEQVELVGGRRQQIFGPLEHVDPAGAAAGGAAGEWDGRVVLIAEVDERGAGRGVDLDDAPGVGFSDDLRRGLHAYIPSARS
jgi:hypothetical protein